LSLPFLIVGLRFVVAWLLLLSRYWVVRRYVLGHRTTPPTASATTE
jgi:hypothetical protein